MTGPLMPVQPSQSIRVPPTMTMLPASNKLCVAHLVIVGLLFGAASRLAGNQDGPSSRPWGSTAVSKFRGLKTTLLSKLRFQNGFPRRLPRIDASQLFLLI